MSIEGRLADMLVLALIALVFLVVGIPTLVVGTLVLVFGGTAWVAVSGAGVLAIGGALLWLLQRAQARARRARAVRPGPTRAFISYSTIEHGPYVHRIQSVLHDAGVVVYVAPPEAMAPEPEHPLTIFRALGLFQTGELDATLQKALLDSDVLIYCVPLSKRRIAVRRQMKDSADSLLAQLLFQAGASTTFWRHVWHMGVYGKAVTPAFRLFDVESWQRWELRTARELGLEVIRAVIADSPIGDAGDIRLRPEALEADVRERVVPLMAGVKRPPPEPTGFLPVMALALLAWGILIGLAILVGISVAAFFLVRALF